MSRDRLGLALLVGLCACQGSASPATTVSTTTSRFALNELIQFEQDPPAPPSDSDKFPLFQLEVSPPAQAFMKLLPEEMSPSRAGDGSLEFHPAFERLGESQPQPAPAAMLSSGDSLVQKTVARMKQAFDQPEEWVPQNAQALKYARAHRGTNAAEDTYEPEQTVLTYVTLRRRVQQWNVEGPGSRFTVAVAANGDIKGVVYYWKSKHITDGSASALQVPDVKAEITRQLTKTEPKARIIVRKVEFAYYDANLGSLQPVYRYVAEATQPEGSVGRNNFYVGYVPLTQNEEVPTEVGGPTSAAAVLNEVPSSLSRLPERKASGIGIGRYVAFDDHAGWAHDADAFWQELSARPAMFSDEQYLYAERLMFTSRKDWFANFVDVALVEGHGVPLGFTTYLSFGGETSLYRDVPLTGYGASGGGNLKHLILHSCRAVPVGEDYFENNQRPWAKAWWDLFNGLSSVVGYRSTMFIDDGASAALARNLVRNEPVVPAWFGAVTSLRVYADGWIKSECADNEPIGRAAAIAVCGMGAKATANQGSSGRPDCLEAWWLSDEQVQVDPSSTPEVASKPTGRCPDEGGGRPPFRKSPPR